MINFNANISANQLKLEFMKFLFVSFLFLLFTDYSFAQTATTKPSNSIQSYAESMMSQELIKHAAFGLYVKDMTTGEVIADYICINNEVGYNGYGITSSWSWISF